MANEDKNGIKILAYILGVIAFLGILIGLTPNGWLRKMFTTTDSIVPPVPTGNAGGRYVNTDGSPDINYTGENKCVLKNSRGEEITISSKENNSLFQRYCQGGSTQPIYLYNDYWYPYSYWYPRFWGRRWFFTRPVSGGHGGTGTGGSGTGTM